MTIFSLDIFGFTLAPTWYGFMYAVSFFLGFLLMRRQFDEKKTDTLLFATILGVILGGRFGYVIFYNLSYFIDHPVEILMPWRGGMSFHGGMIGVIIAWFLVAKRWKTSFLTLADQLVWIVPIGLFFGRIGNLINGELLGMAGYTGPLARVMSDVSYFPTPLLEALLEGLVLFFILIWRRKNIQYAGQVGVWFLGWYGLFRFIAEFLRDPDVQVGYIYGDWMTMGHIFSLVMIAIMIVLSVLLKKK